MTRGFRKDVGFFSHTLGLLRYYFRRIPEFPPNIQVQTVTGCNSSCVFCPRGKTRRRITEEEMPEDLFRKIIDEVVLYPVKRLSPYLMNEPLLDQRLGHLIRIIREKSLSIRVKINTNGAALTEEMARELIESGLSHINFSVHGIVPEVYEQTMVGLKLEHVLHNIDRFLEIRTALDARRPRVRVTMVRTKLLEPQIPAIRDYWGKRGIQIKIQPLENRVNQELEKRALYVVPWKRFQWCRRMFEQAYILANGDLVLCCADWEQSTIMGNCRQVSIAEIWNGPCYREVRLKFLTGHLAGLPCAICKKEPQRRIRFRA